MADRYFVAGGVDNNWGTAGNWSASSGGPGGETVPTASDAVFFDGSSPHCTVDASARVCLSLNFTGYANTITMSQQLTVSGNITLAAGMTVAGTGYLVSAAAGTLTANGKAWKNLSFTTSTTRTLADAWTVDNLKIGSSTNPIVINGFQITTNGDLDRSGASTGGCSGTTTIVLAGTGSWINSTSASTFSNAVAINTAGTITLPTGALHFGGTLTYTAGTVAASGCDMIFNGASQTIDTGGVAMPFNSAAFLYTSTNNTFTLSDDVVVSDALYIGSTTRVHTFTGSTIICAGSVSDSSGALTGGIVTGTTAIKLTGTGTWTFPDCTSGSIHLPVTIDTTGTITIESTSSAVKLGAWTLTAGTLHIDGQDFVIGGGGGGGEHSHVFVG